MLKCINRDQKKDQVHYLFWHSFLIVYDGFSAASQVTTLTGLTDTTSCTSLTIADDPPFCCQRRLECRPHRQGTRRLLQHWCLWQESHPSQITSIIGEFKMIGIKVWNHSSILPSSSGFYFYFVVGTYNQSTPLCLQWNKDQQLPTGSNWEWVNTF